MTCSGICSQCDYGYRHVTKYKCENKNITCDGQCFKCPFRIEAKVEYVCGKLNEVVQQFNERL